MGSDFLSKTKRTFKKHIDKKRADLATPDLFTQTPKDQPRCLLAAVSSGAKLSEGDALIVEPDGDHLVARQGNAVVAKSANPPPDIFTAITGSGVPAIGIVKQMNKLSKTVEVSIC